MDVLARLGGVAAANLLVSACGRASVEAAVRSGLVVRVARGRSALPHTDAALAAAQARAGVVSHLSAARWWGWEIKEQPDAPYVTVPSSRKQRAHYGVGAHVSYRDLPPCDVVGPGVTSKLRTVLDCATVLTFDAALAVADSALRHRDVTAEELVIGAETSPTRGRARRRRVAMAADGRADNPFESVLRAHAIEAGLDVEPQVPIPDR
jgi:predicted transcriptional regulator of viral defense system